MALPLTFTSRVQPSVLRAAERRESPSAATQIMSVMGRTLNQVADIGYEVKRQEDDSEYRIRQKLAERETQAKTVDATVRMVRGRAALGQRIVELEQGAAAGGEGHEEAVRQAWTEWRDEFAASLPDDVDVRQKFAVSLAQEEADLLGKAQRYQIAQRVEKQGRDIEEALDLSANVAATDASPQTAATQAGALYTAIDAMQVPDNDKAKLKRLAGERVFGGMLGGMIDGGRHGEASALLEKGVLNSVLGPEQIKAARARIGVEQRRDEAEAATILAKQKADDKEFVDGIQDRLKDDLIVSDAALQVAAQRAQRSGLDGEIFDLRKARTQSSVNRQYGEATATALRGTIEGYRTRIREAGPKARDEDIWALARLEEIQDKKRGREAEPYRDTWAQGVTGRLSVATQLRALPLEERVAVAGKVDASGSLSAVVQLPHMSMQMAINGRADREANPELVPPQKDMQRAFNTIIGGAGSEIDGQGLASIRDVAGDIYARMAREGGLKAFDKTVYGQAVSMALGREGNGGGLGGYRGKPVLLPQGVTSKGLETVIARDPFTDAEGKAAIVRERFAPRWIGESEQGTAQYVFVDDRGRWLKRKSDPNKPYILDVRR